MERSKALYLVLGCLLLFACTPQKKLIYLQGDKSDFESKKPSIYTYKIQPGDILNINIFSVNEQAANFFSRDNLKQSVANEASSYLQGFTVNDEGYIYMPLVDSINVKGLTTAEISKIIEKKIREYFFDAVVEVKLLNFKVSVLGEVNKPGLFRVYDARLTILEAIGLAGDLTVYGKRNVLLIRQTEKGQKIYEVDLKDRNLLAQEYFYLQPNDIIYVLPHRAKSFGFATFPISTILSAISTILLIINFTTKL